MCWDGKKTLLRNKKAAVSAAFLFPYLPRPEIS
jgi:hypothetical protein